MVDVNILNKESQTVDNRWSFSLMVGQEADSCKKLLVAKCYTGPQTLMDFLD
jgi:hypothetical protein